jgi:predicted nucleic acid-binding protein
VVLVDTSVWIGVFRKPPFVRLDELVEFDSVVTCLPVIQEVLQGFVDDGGFAVARDAMRALPIVESPLGAPLFDEAVDLYRLARRAGLTVRSGVDCLIAACALRHRLTVLHHDRDFESLARVSALSVRQAPAPRRTRTGAEPFPWPRRRRPRRRTGG